MVLMSTLDLMGPNRNQPCDPARPQETLCTLESVKAVGEVYAPVDCEARVWSESGLIRCQ